MKYTATIQPEAWINDYAIPVDAPGPVTWDCTRFAVENREYLDRLAAEENAKYRDPWAEGVTDNDDVFRGDPAAPGWVGDWSGPFTIRISREEV